VKQIERASARGIDVFNDGIGRKLLLQTGDQFFGWRDIADGGIG
jgi:hypothetical protein